MSAANMFKQAELALATYANLPPGISGEDFEDSLVAAGMSPSQAKNFASTYGVVTQFNDASGLSVTIFKEIATGEKTLAIRGTDSVGDLLISDIVDIALLGSRKLHVQYAGLSAQVQQWIDDGVLSAGFSVTGHSLGGFLATGIAADYASYVDHTYLYNTPGVGGLASGILTALGITDPLPDPSTVSNIKAEAGPNIIAGLGTQASPPILIQIEDQTLPDIPNRPAALNHSMQPLTDALAVQSLYARLDSSLTQDQLNGLIDASGVKMRRKRRQDATHAGRRDRCIA